MKKELLDSLKKIRCEMCTHRFKPYDGKNYGRCPRCGTVGRKEKVKIVRGYDYYSDDFR